MSKKFNALAVAGAVFLLIGVIGLAMPVFVTKETRDVLRIGDLKVQATESTPHVIPPLVSGAAVLLGALLLGAGIYRKRA